MTAPALPEDVERALSLFRTSVEVYGAEDGGFRRIDPREAALRAAIAAHVATGGEPVAYDAGSRVVVIGKAINEGHNFVGRTGVVVEPIDHKTARWVRFDGDDNKTSVPMRYLALRPTAPVSESFDAALAALDYEPVDVRDTGQTVYTILGLDDVRAAHAEAVRVAVEKERAECEKVCERFASRYFDASILHGSAEGTRINAAAAEAATNIAAAIRARGAKS